MDENQGKDTNGGIPDTRNSLREQAAPVEVAPLGASRDEVGFEIPGQLPVLPIRDAVVFPGVVMPLQISREKSKRVLDMALAGDRIVGVFTQRASELEDPTFEDLYRIGTASIILKMLKPGDGSEHIIVHGLHRIAIKAPTDRTTYLEAIVDVHQDPEEESVEQKALAHSLRMAAERMIQLSPNIPDEALQLVASISGGGALADLLGANLPLPVEQKQELLETLDVSERLQKANVLVNTQLEVVELSAKIQQKMRSQVDQSRREYYLRQQMKAIQEELGEGREATDRLSELRTRVDAAKMPEAVETEAIREVDRLERVPESSPEYSMGLDYVEWLVELPWSTSTRDNLDLARAEQILDEDHYGLEKVKRRILEYLAVRRLKKESRGPILCFVGPPGVGKTSLGQSIARAIERKFIRISLGGVHDEALIRGHRKTYVGAMPGRIIREIRRAGTNNPLFMLDEVDKLGHDVRGDPMSALLEVLDPAQNSTFTDHYLGLPFDLSRVLFITTANYIAAIEPALRDRMEIIELGSYTHQEKLMIAKNHLVPWQLAENGLKPEQVQFPDEVLSAIIARYTQEAGVRSLEQKIGAVSRAVATSLVRGAPEKVDVTPERLTDILGAPEYESEIAAKKPVPGVATGLAFTPTGGEILFIEAKKIPGAAQLKLTGQLGDVMRESAVAASSILATDKRWRSSSASKAGAFDFHVHVPAGAVPKDGPSAGVAMLVAMASALSGKVVDPSIGMTGEITLSERVLPVGGIREKLVAAHRAGLKTVIVPRRNEAQLAELPEEVRSSLKCVLVDTVGEVLDFVFDQAKAKPRTGKGRRSTASSPRTGSASAKQRKAAASK